MNKLDITKILSSTKYKLDVSKHDTAVFVVDAPKAADKILKLTNSKIPIRAAFKKWCAETKRSGGVLVGSSIREFFDYYEKLNSNDY